MTRAATREQNCISVTMCTNESRMLTVIKLFAAAAATAACLVNSKVQKRAYRKIEPILYGNFFYFLLAMAN